jgi:hypothetical protein
MKKLVLVMTILSLVAVSTVAWAKKKQVVTRSTQVVDFSGDTVDGTARHPDAAYLVQKRGVDFVPLYKVRDRFDENIKSSVNFLK